MNIEIFADGIGAIHITGNLIRIDLMTVQPQLAKEGGEPVIDMSRRIIMPLEGFVQAVAMQQEIMRQNGRSWSIAKKTSGGPGETN